MRAPARTNDLTFVIAGLVLMTALTVVSFLVAPKDGAPTHSGSSYASYPAGAKAAFMYLQQTGYDVRRSFEPFAALHAEPSTTVVLLADPLVEPSRSDRAALAAFVEAGGVVLAAGSATVAFLPDLTAGETRPEGQTPVRAYAAALPSPLARTAPTVEMAPAPRHIRTGDRPWVPVYGTHDDPGVLTVSMGSGRVIWWASSHPLSNAAIVAPGHLELLLNAIGAPAQRRVLWDEHYHGHRRSVWSYAVGTPVIWALVQVGLIGCVALFTFGRRYGPMRSRPIEPRTSTLEFIDTLGALYARARPVDAAVATARARVRRLLQLRAGLPASSSDDEIVSALAGRSRIDSAEVRTLLERSGIAARDPSTAQSEAVALVAKLQALAAEFTSTGPRNGAPKAAVPDVTQDRSD